MFVLITTGLQLRRQPKQGRLNKLGLWPVKPPDNNSKVRFPLNLIQPLRNDYALREYRYKIKEKFLVLGLKTH